MTKQNLGNWFADQLAIYQSANNDYPSVKNNFIIRKAEYQIIIDGLFSKKSKDSIQHELIVGRRGSGKSTLLKRIEVEIAENPILNQKYIAINFAEEQAGIYRLFDLWEQVLYELQSKEYYDQKLPEYNRFEDDMSYTRHLYQLIHTYCAKYEKKIVLLLDNFDRIVENFTDDGNLLRETLINYNDIQLIGGSTRMDEHFWRYDMPFYNFFRVHRLEALSREETHQLINHWGDSLHLEVLKDFVKNHTGKIENIRILTDGLPRTIQFFIQIVLQKSDLDTYEYLKKTMDIVSPLYQERLNHLTAQLRKIVYDMAFIWEACSTKQLVEKTKMESNLISANLKTLESKGIVDKIPTSKKQHLYRISERFFNMWIIVTQGNPEQKRRAKWLSIFLEHWYDGNDLKNMAKNHIATLASGSMNWQQALVLSKGLSQSKYLTIEERDEIITLTEKLKPSPNETYLIELPKHSQNIIKNIQQLIEEKDYPKAIQEAESIENEADGLKFFVLAYIYGKEEKYNEAEKFYLLACKKGNIEAMFNLAILYKNQEKLEEAEKYYLLAIDKGDISAMYNLALLYQNQEKLEEAEKYYLLAIDKGHSRAIYNLAILYENQEKFSEAEKYYLLAIEKGDSDAMYNLALLYENLGKLEEAEKYYLLAIDKGHISAMYNLAVLYKNQEKFNEAEKYYLLAIEQGENDAMNNLAILYLEQNQQKANALEMIHRVQEVAGSNQIDALALIIELWNGIFIDVEKRVVEIVDNDNEGIASKFIKLLLVHQQKSLVKRLFEHEKVGILLKEQYIVLYYVSELLNTPNDPDFALKIPIEVKETVQEILDNIMAQEKFYNYTF